MLLCLLLRLQSGVDSGYSFAVDDGQGNIIVAKHPSATEGATVILTTPEAFDSPIAQTVLTLESGRVTCGCVLEVNSTRYLFAGLAEAGAVLRLDLSFPGESGVKYLRATDSDLLWNSQPAQIFVSAVCQGQQVYFGSKSPTGSSFVIRLNVNDADPLTRFHSLGQVAPGDLTFASTWGDNAVMFAMEPDGDVPLTFFIISTSGSTPVVESANPLTSVLPGFETLSGMAADPNTKRVVTANGNGVGHIVLLDLSQSGQAIVEQELSLASLDLPPITTFTVDTLSRYAYATIGSCATEKDVATVAIRLAPTLTQSETYKFKYNCTDKGVPSSALLVNSGNARQLLVLTEVVGLAVGSLQDGTLAKFDVFGTKPCPSDCNEADGHGECAGEICYCYNAWTGTACETPVPCGGTGCSGHGTCNNNLCGCEAGWEGLHCDVQKTCPLDCSGRGSCELGVCKCIEGFVGEACDLHAVGCELLADCNNHGSCVLGYPTGTCNCHTGFLGIDCSVPDVGCLNACSNHGSCSQMKCTCVDGWTGEDCSVEVPRCPNNCSNHGICSSGRCTCLPGHKGIDCSIEATVAPPCLNNCTNHGSCVNGVCSCEWGWSSNDCSVGHVSQLEVLHDVELPSGENAATTSFVIDVTGKSLVFCFQSQPGQCVLFDPTSLSIIRPISFSDPTAVLLQSSVESKANRALVPGMGSAVSLVEISSMLSPLAPFSVSVVNDVANNGFAILGTHATGEGFIHGQLIKISTTTFEKMAEFEFEDDNGLGVSTAISAGDGTFFFASGNSPAILYHINSDLEILSRSSVSQSPNGEVSALIFDGTKFLFASTGNTIYVYQIVDNSIQIVNTIDVPVTLGTITCGFATLDPTNPAVYFGTSGSPGAVLRVSRDGTQLGVTATLRLGEHENKITTVVYKNDLAFFGLGSDGEHCFVAKVKVSTLTEIDSLRLQDCHADFTSSSIAALGDFAYFGNGASPAHVFGVRLTSASCASNCHDRGTCIDGVCVCSSGFTGPDCSSVISSCPRNCSRAGNCINGVCHCSPYRSGEDCSVITHCRDKCEHGSCVGLNHTWPCVCESHSWAGEWCSEQVNKCPDDCSGHGLCRASTCICDEGFTGDKCSVSTLCTKDEDCSDSNTCDTETGKCVEKDSGSSVSTTTIIIAVVAALGAGAAGLFGLAKLWKHQSPSGPYQGTAIVTDMSGPSRVLVGEGGGYTRLPRRLVK
eukprot:c9758_g1_i1.p1 GENE.c9758_g1_i1~~c9758_g1_i1.p1  ORF type:complete len:1216 (+),score=295.48 c9758_g1_i1:19-3666(+)